MKRHLYYTNILLSLPMHLTQYLSINHINWILKRKFHIKSQLSNNRFIDPPLYIYMNIRCFHLCFCAMIMLKWQNLRHHFGSWKDSQEIQSWSYLRGYYFKENSHFYPNQAISGKIALAIKYKNVFDCAQLMQYGQIQSLKSLKLLEVEWFFAFNKLQNNQFLEGNFC